jgi:hypothetical protein
MCEPHSRSGRSSPCRESKPGRPAHSLVTILTGLPRLLLLQVELVWNDWTESALFCFVPLEPSIPVLGDGRSAIGPAHCYVRTPWSAILGPAPPISEQQSGMFTPQPPAAVNLRIQLPHNMAWRWATYHKEDCRQNIHNTQQLVSVMTWSRVLPENLTVAHLVKTFRRLSSNSKPRHHVHVSLSPDPTLSLKNPVLLWTHRSPTRSRSFRFSD